MNLRRIVPDGSPSLPLHDSDASRRVEADAAAALPPMTLMQRAGFAVARVALAVAPHARRVHVAAGPGNNGGDGLLAALHLHRSGKDVTVALLADPRRLPPDASRALAEAQAGGVRFVAADAAPAAELQIDALLGLGLRRAPDGAIAAAIARLNAGTAPVLAIDLPSGLHADSGVALGDRAVRATDTVSLLTLKPGLFTGAGRDHAGRIWFDDLGVDLDRWPAAQQLGGIGDALALLRGRPHASHKGSFGDVAIVGGAPGMTGAALLAAQAALAAGAGRVFCSLLDDGATLPFGTRPELMQRRRWWEADAAQIGRCTTVSGCGGGAAVRVALPALLQHAARLVLDADALNAIAGDRALQARLRDRSGRGQSTVLTPHPLEAARLLGVDTAEVQRDRVGAARTLAERCACSVVLKGSGSVIATPGRPTVINPTGNAMLAGAGSGDVLAGWAGGLWSQAPGTLDHLPHRVAVGATWLHGAAADRSAAAASPRLALRALDLVEVLRATVDALPR